MTVTAAVLASHIECPSCKGPVDVKSRHVSIDGTAIRVYCSDECLRGRHSEPILEIEPPRRRAAWWLVGGLVVGTTSFVLWYETAEADDEVSTPSAISYFIEAGRPPHLPEPAAAAKLETAPPPSSEEVEEAALVEELAHDTFIHPLAGPERRMPVNHTAAFGASRPGERPPECISGHCGVDIGSNWGEPIHAVHDGVVYWVNRGPNEGHGGIFVELSHRNGQLYSWYFHLAGVPRWVKPGAKVKAGQVIGLLGDTDVGSAPPHLHFQLSVKPPKTNHERYLDPEPLIALWPLWVANDNATTGHLTTAIAPGLPVREHDVFKPKPAAIPDAGVAEPVPAAAPTP